MKKATFNIFLTCYFFPLLSKELLRADRGVSEHRVSLQHELPGGDHRLVGCYEPAHQPERWLNVTPACAPSAASVTTAFQSEKDSVAVCWCVVRKRVMPVGRFDGCVDCRYICFDCVIMKLCMCEFQILTVNKNVSMCFNCEAECLCCSAFHSVL